MPQGKTLQECNEEWRLIEGFPDYMVSNTGRVMHLGFIKTLKRGFCYYKKPWILKMTKVGRGYLGVSLKDEQGYHLQLVHRLVANAFILNEHNKPQVNHIDGIKTNNNVTNLEWCTDSENMEHALKTGLKSSGCSVYNSKLTYNQILDIRTNCVKGKKGFSIIDFAKKYGVVISTISNVLKWKTYKYGFKETSALWTEGF